MPTDDLTTDLPDDWRERKEDLVDLALRRWEAARIQGENPSPQQLCAGWPAELLEQVAEGIALLEKFEVHFDRAASDRSDDARPFRAGVYEGAKVIDQGGQGTVILAEDHSLGRKVAIKIVRSGSLSKSFAGERLERESRIAGNLEHPGVIPVYGFGRDSEGNPYYAMRYVPREHTLHQSILELHKNGNSAVRSTAFRQLLQVFVTVCRTVAYAHSKNVIHRDLKPSNVLLGDYGEVFVIDFGIAKSFHEHITDNRTLHEPAVRGAMDHSRTVGPMGTPAYMSPEQAEDSSRVGKSSDIYSLGATLYELLIGRPPISGKSPIDAVDYAKAGRIAHPRSENRNVPSSLAAVCLKALSYRPQDRYDSANDLADDVQRWLDDEPVTAWPDPWHLRARRWVNRHRALVSAIVSVVLLGLISLTAIVILLAYKNHLLEIANDKTTKALEDTKAAQQAERQVATKLAQSLYRNQFFLAASAWREFDAKRAEQILDECDPTLRSFEWFHLKKLCRPPRGLEAGRRIFSVNRDGEYVAAWSFERVPAESGVFRRVKLIELKTGNVLQQLLGADLDPTDLFSPDGRLFAVATADDQVAMFDVQKNRLVRSFPGREFVFSPDSSMIATISSHPERINRVTTWRVDTNEEVSQFECQGQVYGFAFRDDSRSVVVASDKWLSDIPQKLLVKFSVWDIVTGTPLLNCDGPELRGDGLPVVLNSNGRLAWVANANENGRKQSIILDTTTGQTVSTLQAGRAIRTTAVQFSPTSRYIATVGGDHSLRIWDVRTGEPFLVMAGQDIHVDVVAFSPDGNMLATTGRDRAIRVWDLGAGGNLLNTFRGRDERDLRFLPDGRRIVSAGLDDRVRIWNIDARGVSRLSRGGAVPEAYAIAIGPSDATSLAAIHTDGFARVWNLETGDEQFAMRFNQGEKESRIHFYRPAIAISNDGSKLAIAGLDELRVWDARSQREVCLLSGTDGPVVFTPDSQRILTIRRARTLAQVFHQENLVDQLQNETLRERREIINGPDPFVAEILKGEQKLLALLRAKARSLVIVADAKTGQIQAEFGDAPQAIAVHPNGSIVAAVGGDGTVAIWDLLGQGVHTNPYSPKPTLVTEMKTGHDTVAFSPDGRWLVTCGGLEEVAQVWATKTWTLHAELSAHKDLVPCLAFSSDGRRLATGSCDKTLNLWDAETWQLLWTFDEPKFPVRSVVFSPDGRRLIASTYEGGRPGETGKAMGEFLIWDTLEPDSK